MLPCQVALKENSKCNLTPISHIMKILMMHERGIFLSSCGGLFQSKLVTWCEICYHHWIDFIMAPQITKVQYRKWGKDGGLEVWAFYLAGKRDVSFQYHSLSLERLIACGVAAPEMKLTISTGMHWHIILYFNCSLYDSVKSRPEAVFLLS